MPHVSCCPCLLSPVLVLQMNSRIGIHCVSPTLKENIPPSSKPDGFQQQKKERTVLGVLSDNEQRGSSLSQVWDGDRCCGLSLSQGAEGDSVHTHWSEVCPWFLSSGRPIVQTQLCVWHLAAERPQLCVQFCLWPVCGGGSGGFWSGGLRSVCGGGSWSHSVRFWSGGLRLFRSWNSGGQTHETPAGAQPKLVWTLEEGSCSWFDHSSLQCVLAGSCQDVSLQSEDEPQLPMDVHCEDYIEDIHQNLIESEVSYLFHMNHEQCCLSMFFILGFNFRRSSGWSTATLRDTLRSQEAWGSSWWTGWFRFPRTIGSVLKLSTLPSTTWTVSCPTQQTWDGTSCSCSARPHYWSLCKKTSLFKVLCQL